MQAIGRTDVGRVREHNEDTIFFSTDPVGSLPNLFIVADGMGGHNAGEVASAKAVEYCYAFLRSYPKKLSDILDILIAATHQANRDVFELSISNPAYNGMGTTFTACCIIDNILSISHIGDSRLYIFNDGQIHQLTKDQTMVQDLIDAGSITPDEARNHPRRNMLTRVLGCDPHTKADGSSYDLQGVGSILLCSDGLTDMLTNSEINKIVNKKSSTQNRVEALINAANDSGGVDNISAMIIDL